MAFVRRFIVVVLSLTIFVVTLPAHADVLHAAKQSCCCGHSPAANQSDGNNCCGEPIKSQAQQCCSNSVSGMNLLAANSIHLIFQKSDGEKLVGKDVSQLVRSERPPVPPPRLTVVA